MSKAHHAGPYQIGDIADKSTHAVFLDAGALMRRDGMEAGSVFGQCHRVLRPGGFMLAFADPKIFHRAAVAIEDSVGMGEFEMRDVISWAHPKEAPTTTSGLVDEVTLISVVQKKKEGTFVDNWISHGTGLIDTTQNWGGKFPSNVAEGEDQDRVEIARHLMRVFGKAGDTVLDAYSEGTEFVTAAVAENRMVFRPRSRCA